MNENYVQVDPLLNLKSEWNEDKKEWKPKWNEARMEWEFISKKTGLSYFYDNLVQPCLNPVLKTWYQTYIDMGKNTSRVEYFSSFVESWLNSMLNVNSVYHAENIRLKYLDDNRDDLEDRKKMGKIHKASEAEYVKAMNDYMKIYERF